MLKSILKKFFAYGWTVSAPLDNAGQRVYGVLTLSVQLDESLPFQFCQSNNRIAI